MAWAVAWSSSISSLAALQQTSNDGAARAACMRSSPPSSLPHRKPAGDLQEHKGGRRSKVQHNELQPLYVSGAFQARLPSFCYAIHQALFFKKFALRPGTVEITYYQALQDSRKQNRA